MRSILQRIAAGNPRLYLARISAGLGAGGGVARGGEQGTDGAAYSYTKYNDGILGMLAIQMKKFTSAMN
jgi:hypothetical protein